MNFTRALNALRGISWRYAAHHSKDGRRSEAEALILRHYEDKNLGSRGVEYAEIV